MESKASGTALVTGANRGIGLELARQYAAKGYRVIATARRPDQASELQALAKAHPRVTIDTLDVTDTVAIDVLAAKYSGQSIDVLINNAGVLADVDRQRFGMMSFDDFDDIMRTNTKAPLKMSEAFIENVAISSQKKLAVITSSVASIANVGSGKGPLFYPASKIAVNMIMRNVAMAVKDKGVTVVLVNPGPVDTDMMRLARSNLALRSPQLAAREVMAVISGATLDKTGAFFNFDGTILPW